MSLIVGPIPKPTKPLQVGTLIKAKKLARRDHEALGNGVYIAGVKTEDNPKPDMIYVICGGTRVSCGKTVQRWCDDPLECSSTYTCTSRVWAYKAIRVAGCLTQKPILVLASDISWRSHTISTQ